MQFIKNPPTYSSAFSDAVYTISASPTEIVDIDIYNNDNTTIIGKKRFTGYTEYHMNIANYAKRQISVNPLQPDVSSIQTPTGRVIYVRVKSGTLTRTAILTSSLKNMPFLTKLSNAPDHLTITPSGRYEYTTLNDDNIVSPKIEFFGRKGTKTINITPSTTEFELLTVCINMPELNNRLIAMGAGKISDYHTMKLSLSGNYTEINLSQTFDIVEENPNDIRLCWWNYQGQTDYYTMKGNREESLSTKQRIYTSQGYKTIASTVDHAIQMVSNYENATTMNWLKEIIGSPSVWIDSAEGLIPIEITTTNIITKSEELIRLEISAVYKLKTTYQNT